LLALWRFLRPSRVCSSSLFEYGRWKYYIALGKRASSHEDRTSAAKLQIKSRAEMEDSEIGIARSSSAVSHRTKTVV
jgi:hypothetical protein